MVGQNKEVNLQWITTHNRVADVFTKAVFPGGHGNGNLSHWTLSSKKKLKISPSALAWHSDIFLHDLRDVLTQRYLIYE